MINEKRRNSNEHPGKGETRFSKPGQACQKAREETESGKAENRSLETIRMCLKSQSQAYILVGNKGSERLQRQRLESRAQSSIGRVASSGLPRFQDVSAILMDGRDRVLQA